MRRTALLAIALAWALAAPANAHQGDPNFESIVTAVDGAPGVKAEVLGGDDRVLIVNTSDETVVVAGYDGEPYARVRGDGTVEVNRRSPATYLNDDRYGEVQVPAEASKDAEPRWEVVGHNGRFEFHDHRMHWMSRTRPPQVHDETERTRIFDWTVPLRVGERTAAIRGTLWWRGTGDGGAPVAAFAGLGVFALLGAVAVVVVRRRRRAAAGGAEPGAEGAGEAW
jgi:LPXTG-motif cell wall-anchored protein